jgi:16S rRNA (uracil1498-N3)-methyltransferase
MSERFYISSPLHPGPIELAGPEAHHLATVCRFRPGDAVCLFNGDGREYPARIVAVARKRVQVEVLRVEEPARELPFSLEVAAPLPRGDRAAFLVEKLTELGVTSFVPLSCARSVVHPRDGKLEKLERHVIEASKQCGRNRLMSVGDLSEWGSYCGLVNGSERRLLAHPGGKGRLGQVLPTVPAETAVQVVVGPEGGLSDAEVALACAHGWQPIDLGPRILRVETAAIALAAQVIGIGG